MSIPVSVTNNSNTINSNSSSTNTTNNTSSSSNGTSSFDEQKAEYKRIVAQKKKAYKEFTKKQRTEKEIADFITNGYREIVSSSNGTRTNGHKKPTLTKESFTSSSIQADLTTFEIDFRYNPYIKLNTHRDDVKKTSNTCQGNSNPHKEFVTINGKQEKNSKFGTLKNQHWQTKNDGTLIEVLNFVGQGITVTPALIPVGVDNLDIHVEKLHFWAFDIDYIDQQIPRQQVLTALQDILGGFVPNAWYPSRSWSLEANKYRILIVFDKPILGSESKKMYTWVEERIKEKIPGFTFDKACKNPSTFFYGCLPETYEIFKDDLIINDTEVLSTDWLRAEVEKSDSLFELSVLTSSSNGTRTDETKKVRKPGRPSTKSSSSNGTRTNDENDDTTINIKVNNYLTEKLFYEKYNQDINAFCQGVFGLDLKMIEKKNDEHNAITTWHGLTFNIDATNNNGDSGIITLTEDTGLQFTSRASIEWNEQDDGTKKTGGTIIDVFRQVCKERHGEYQNVTPQECFVQCILELTTKESIPVPPDLKVGFKNITLWILAKLKGDAYVANWVKSEKSHSYYALQVSFDSCVYKTLTSYEFSEYITDYFRENYNDLYRYFDKAKDGKTSIKKRIKSVLDNDLTAKQLIIEDINKIPEVRLDYFAYSDGLFDTVNKQFLPYSGIARQRICSKHKYQEYSKEQLEAYGDYFKSLLTTVFDGNQLNVDYVLNYCILVLQNRALEVGSIPYLIGNRGSGKSAVGELMKSMMEEFTVTDTAPILLGNKHNNEVLVNKRFWFIDEFAGNATLDLNKLLTLFGGKQRSKMMDVDKKNLAPDQEVFCCSPIVNSEGEPYGTKTTKDGYARRFRYLMCSVKKNRDCVQGKDTDILGFLPEETAVFEALTANPGILRQWLLSQDADTALKIASESSDIIFQLNKETALENNDIAAFANDLIEVTNNEEDITHRISLDNLFLDFVNHTISVFGHDPRLKENGNITSGLKLKDKLYGYLSNEKGLKLSPKRARMDGIDGSKMCFRGIKMKNTTDIFDTEGT
jgi:hypothetical protein